MPSDHQDFELTGVKQDVRSQLNTRLYRTSDLYAGRRIGRVLITAWGELLNAQHRFLASSLSAAHVESAVIEDALSTGDELAKRFQTKADRFVYAYDKAVSEWRDDRLEFREYEGLEPFDAVVDLDELGGHTVELVTEYDEWGRETATYPLVELEGFRVCTCSRSMNSIECHHGIARRFEDSLYEQSADSGGVSISIE